jgi:thiol-disulfide isomerase/thioredoxin
VGETEEVQPKAKGTYKDYSSELLASTKGTKLLFFHASWCPQCRALDESIRTSELPDNVTIFKVDYDSNQALRAKYGVTLQTTVVKVDDNQDKLASYVAYNEPTFQSVKQALLP